MEPLVIKMTDRDNVAIVANDGGLPPGTALPDGLVLKDQVPQGHKVALVDLKAGDAVLRYGVRIGRALRDIEAGRWVHERLLEMPEARGLDGLPMASAKAPPLAPLEGHSFQGYRNADGSVGTRNLLEALKCQPVPPRLIFASSLHVFGRTQDQPPPRTTSRRCARKRIASTGERAWSSTKSARQPGSSP